MATFILWKPQAILTKVSIWFSWMFHFNSIKDISIFAQFIPAVSLKSVLFQTRSIVWLTNQYMYIDDDLRMVLKEASVHSTVILRCRCHADCGAEIQRQESIWSSLPIRFSAKLILSQFNELFKGGLKASRTFTSDHLKFCDPLLSETFVYSTHIEKYWSKHLKIKVGNVISK